MRPRKSPYSGAPRWAMIAISRGWRASTSDMGDGRASGPSWPGRLRPGGSGNRGGRGRPAARTRPGPARRRGDRDGLVRPALERVFAGPAGAEPARRGGTVPRPRRDTARAGPDARRGAAGPDPDLRPRLPGPGGWL